MANYLCGSEKSATFATEIRKKETKCIISTLIITAFTFTLQAIVKRLAVENNKCLNNKDKGSASQTCESGAFYLNSKDEIMKS